MTRPRSLLLRPAAACTDAHRSGPRPTTLTRLGAHALYVAEHRRLDALRRAAAGGLQDCYDATCHQLGFDPLA